MQRGNVMKLHFMKYRKLSYIISGALLLVSVLSIIFRGFNSGLKSDNSERILSIVIVSTTGVTSIEIPPEKSIP